MSTHSMVYKCQGHQERHNTYRHWIEQHLLSHRRNRARSASTMGFCHSWSIGPSLWPMQGNGLHSPLFCYKLRTYSLPAGIGYNSGVGQVPYDAHAQAEQRSTQNLKQGKILPHKVLNPAEAAKALYVLKKTYSRPYTRYHTAKQGSEDCTHVIAFPIKIKRVKTPESC